MTKLRENLINIFESLSLVESSKGNIYQSRAFQSVSNALKNSDHYMISKGKVIISNHTTGFIKVLGNSSSSIFIEYLKTGECSRLINDPIYSSDLDNITGIGNTKKIKLIKAGITNSKELTKLNLSIGSTIPGTNLTFTQQMDVGLRIWNKTHGKRINRSEAIEYIDDFKSKITPEIYVLGSYRRLKPTIGDLDIVIVKSNIDYSNKIINWLDDVLVHGDTKIAGIKGQTQVDIRIIDKQYLGAHILHGTGSQEFNIKLRSHAKSLGLKLNEYCIIKKDGTKVFFDKEEQVFDYLDLNYVPPELR